MEERDLGDIIREDHEARFDELAPGRTLCRCCEEAPVVADDLCQVYLDIRNSARQYQQVAARDQYWRDVLTVAAAIAGAVHATSVTWAYSTIVSSAREVVDEINCQRAEEEGTP